MKFNDSTKRAVSVWLPIVGGPIAALITFIVSYKLDPLSQDNFRGISSFYFSVIALMIGQWLATVLETQKATENSHRLCETVKNYLHVTTIGPPDIAMGYILSRMPILKEVRNTSFNTEDEIEQSEEKIYQSTEYEQLCSSIPIFCKAELVWKDIGDQIALPRLRKLHNEYTLEKSKPSRYKYRILSHKEPQINFILLEFKDGITEVLFNWDFRGLGRSPIVLVSRDERIVEMFAIQFNLLWRSSSEDHDINIIKSTSIK